MPGFVVAALLAGAVAGTTIAAAGVTLGFSWAAFGAALVLGGLSRALAKPPSAQGGGSFFSDGRNLSIRQPISPWKVIVGESREGGVLTFAELLPDKSKLHVIVTFACHECEGIGDFYLDDELVTPAMLDDDGNVTSGEFTRDQHTARVHGATVPSSAPYTVTVPHPVGFVESVSRYEPRFEYDTLLHETSQWTRSGREFTFTEESAGKEVVINYTEVSAVPLLRIVKSLGDEAFGTQPFPDLVAASDGKWTVDHRQDGHTKVWFTFDREILATRGLPQISAVIKGLKLEDPRTGTTYWTPNNALAVAAYLQNDEWGLDADLDDEVDAATLEASADVCEERVSQLDVSDQQKRFVVVVDVGDNTLELAFDSRTPMTGAGVRFITSDTLPSPLAVDTDYYAIRVSERVFKVATSYANAIAGTPINLTDNGTGKHRVRYFDEQRYAANGSFLTSERPGDIIERLLGSMAGRAAHVSDRWYIHAGAYEAPTETLGEDEFYGPIKIDPLPTREASATSVKGVFVDPDLKWQPTDLPAIESDTFLSQDQDEHNRADIDLTAFERSHTRGQRLEKIELLRRRNGLTFSATFRLTAWRVMTARTVNIELARYGWEPKVFEVLESAFVVLQTPKGPALGVQMSFRETAAAIYDWDTSEETRRDLTPNTSLPGVSKRPAPPGIPVVSEELYETTGSAGVKARLRVRWDLSTGPFVRAHVLEWKRSDWAEYRRVETPGGLLDIDDVQPGIHLLRTIAIGEFGQESRRSATVTFEARGLIDNPGPLVDFSVTPLGPEAEFTWARHEELDVRIGGRIQIYWNPATSGAVFNDSVLVKSVPGDARSAKTPNLSGTYYGRALDSGGRPSTLVSLVTTEPDLIGFNAVETLTVDPEFLGTKDSVAEIDGSLQLAGSILIDDMTDLIDTWGLIDTLGGTSTEGTLELDDPTQIIDLGGIYTIRVTARLATHSFENGDTIDNWLDLIDSWGLIDGPEITGTSCELFVATTEDDPAGTPTWSDWKLFVVGDYKARGFKFMVRLRSENADYNIAVDELEITVDMPDRDQALDFVTSSGGITTVTWTITPGFKVAPKLGVTMKDMATGNYTVITNETAAGFQIDAFNAAGSRVVRNGTARAKAY